MEIPLIPSPAKKGDQMTIFTDVEANEGSGVRVNPISFALVGDCKKTRRRYFAINFVFTPIAGRNSESHVKSFWSRPDTIESWRQIKAKAIPRIEAANAVRELMKRIKDAGWTTIVYARPAAYDFGLITSFFTTLGIEYAHQRFEVNGEIGTPTQILDQVLESRDLRKPEEGNPDDPASPFGFGGLSHVLDMAPFMLGYVAGLGLEPKIYFNDMMKKIVGRINTHDSLLDAQNHAAVWYRFEDLKDEIEAARASGDSQAFQDAVGKLKSLIEPIPEPEVMH